MQATRGGMPLHDLHAIDLLLLAGAALILVGIASSLLARRFGAPLLLVFLLVGMMAGEGGPGGIKFDDVGTAYTVGSIALALILFDGGLRTRIASLRNVIGPAVLTLSGMHATILLWPVRASSMEASLTAWA